MKKVKDEKQLVFDKMVEIINNMLQSARAQDLRELPELKATTDIYDDLGVDSVELMDLVVLIEGEFEVSIEIEKAAQKRTLGALADYVYSLREGK